MFTGGIDANFEMPDEATSVSSMLGTTTGEDILKEIKRISVMVTTTLFENI